MKSLQGFINISSLVTNIPGRNSPIGELSSQSATYSKEKGLYTDNVDGSIQLITFSSTDQNGELVEANQSLINEVIGMVRKALEYANTNQRPYDQTQFLAELTLHASRVGTGFQMGPLVDGLINIGLPAWMAWRSLLGGGTEVRIWIADAYFADQFSGYEMTVIPPIQNLNLFFNNYQDVVDLIDARSTADLNFRIRQAKANHPETFIEFIDFEFVNRYNPEVRKLTTWVILGYGKEGDNEDARKDAIIDYIVSNSNQNQEQWEIIFPDIFKRTEMVVIPRFDKIAAQNFEDRSSLYSGVLDPAECLQLAESFVTFYPAQHVASNLSMVQFTFKTVAALIVNGVKNARGKETFIGVYPDFIPVPNMSLDAARMTHQTQLFALFMNEMLMHAENPNVSEPLPEGFRRITRDGKIFLTSVHNGINFLVATKANSIYD